MVLHQLSGFDKDSELIAVEHPAPVAQVDRVKRIARVPAADNDIFGAYPLDEAQVVLSGPDQHTDQSQTL
jgi:hypothetical protein